MKQNSSVVRIIQVGLFAAIISAVSPISIPLPSGVPFTLQTFIIPLCGFVLGWKLGTLSTLIYLLIGLFGVPVFSGFSGGVGVLFGKTGGFLIGFPILTLLAGLSFKVKNKPLGILIALSGLLIDHLLGILQFAFLMELSFGPSALYVSVPFLLKDTICVLGAYLAAIGIKKALAAANLSVV